jgi:branched-chain amino acid transport system ATP-binding protein
MLEVQKISKRYGGFVAVDSVSFTVAAGDLVGLIGPNGAGKSTLFSLLSGFISSDDGHVNWQGRDVTRLAPERRARLGLARTFQTPQEFARLTVRDNLSVAAPRNPGEGIAALYLRPGLVRRHERALREKVDAMLETIGLGRQAEATAGSLSGGQRKLLELGRLLMTGPRLVLLDEPFAGVNPVLIEELSHLIRRQNEAGVTFMIVEHNLDALMRLVRFVHVMDRGRILTSGEPHEVLADAAVHEAYLGGSL